MIVSGETDRLIDRQTTNKQQISATEHSDTYRHTQRERQTNRPETLRGQKVMHNKQIEQLLHGVQFGGRILFGLFLSGSFAGLVCWLHAVRGLFVLSYPWQCSWSPSLILLQVVNLTLGKGQCNQFPDPSIGISLKSYGFSIYFISFSGFSINSISFCYHFHIYIVLLHTSPYI